MYVCTFVYKIMVHIKPAGLVSLERQTLLPLADKMHACVHKLMFTKQSLRPSVPRSPSLPLSLALPPSLIPPS